MILIRPGIAGNRSDEKACDGVIDIGRKALGLCCHMDICKYLAAGNSWFGVHT